MIFIKDSKKYGLYASFCRDDFAITLAGGRLLAIVQETQPEQVPGTHRVAVKRAPKKAGKTKFHGNTYLGQGHQEKSLLDFLLLPSSKYALLALTPQYIPSSFYRSTILGKVPT